jgi:D-alanine-D-alanine ligase
MKTEDLPKKIAVLMGGPGSERDVSLATGLQLPKDVDLAFLTIHGTFGEDGTLQKLLEDRGVSYTGEGVEGSRSAFDKFLTKEKFRAHNVVTPDWEVIEVGQRPKIPVPLVVKPPCQGSTVGVVIVKDESELDSAIKEAGKYDRKLLVEKFVSGRELTIGILGDQALPILEIIPKGGFYDFTNKYPFLNPQAGGGAEHVCPARIDEKKTAEIQELALRAFRALGLRVYGRADVILSDSGEPFVLEVNTIPGMTEASLLPEAAAVAGIGYVDLCARIIALSRARTRGNPG